MQVYLVGGAVRDELLGRTVRERDWVVVGATPEEMERAGYRAVGRDFPVFLHPDSHEEYALARVERKIAPGYRGFAIESSPNVTLEEDLRRRDLTINALARRADGTLIDPYGGQADLHARLLRHVSAAFTEDPVRILRVARFAARFAGLGFTVAPETLALMRTMVSAGETAALVSERVWRELELALGTAHPERAVEVLRDCGALAGLLPELAQSPDLPLGLASLRCAANGVENAAATPLRWAALLSGLPVSDIEALCTRLRVPTEHRQLALLAARLRASLRGDGSPAEQSAAGPEWLLDLLELADAFRRPERFSQWLEVLSARTRAAGHDTAAAARLVARLRASQHAAARVQLSEADLKERRGPEIGALLRSRRLAALAAIS
ncbi:MAG TPA: multifunctional CCA tRNA nucleotidyl transferase/2'3'-cyclic phosphodiesterase/2'nucleotidase/phosphatase [Steroidobacteraceae bacterium]|nr:multifunctional CCA tRNA nucleotidyl transferase/2'3'-cyclic phosphodiesterase/2'nucleotidase/phosphatase [Steroidobacteraceae bacterium]